MTNDARRFHVFVANRVQQIKELSKGAQWRHIQSDKNPTDEASRGMSGKEFVQPSKWISGPEFLWGQSIPDLEIKVQEVSCDDSDPEVRKATTGAIKASACEDFSLDRFQCFSSWSSLKRSVAVCLRSKSRLQERKAKTNRCQSMTKAFADYKPVKISDLEKAENEAGSEGHILRGHPGSYVDAKY